MQPATLPPAAQTQEANLRSEQARGPAWIPGLGAAVGHPPYSRPADCLPGRVIFMDQSMLSFLTLNLLPTRWGRSQWAGQILRSRTGSATGWPGTRSCISDLPMAGAAGHVRASPSFAFISGPCLRGESLSHHPGPVMSETGYQGTAVYHSVSRWISKASSVKTEEAGQVLLLLKSGFGPVTHLCRGQFPWSSHTGGAQD